MRPPPPEAKKFIELMAATLADQGELIEFGWQALRKAAIKPNAPEIQLVEMRFAFFAGAQHLLGSLTAIMGGGELPTEKDLGRLDRICEELQGFLKEWEERMERVARGKA